MINKKFLSTNLGIGYGTLDRLLNSLGYKPVQGKTVYDDSVYVNLSKFKEEHPDIRAFLYQDTCMKKYGVTNVSKSDVIKQKKETSYLKHYGVNHFAKTVEWKEKTIKANQDKFGVDFPSQRKDIAKKQSSTCKNLREVFEKEHPNLIALSDCPALFNRKDLTTVWVQLDKLNIETYRGPSNSIYISREDLPLLENYFNKRFHSGQATGEQEILHFLQDTYTGIIEQNNRQVIAPKELDLYLPEASLAIEHNGIYYHRDKDKNYHLSKLQACKNQGIRLIQFWDCEWNEKQIICKSIIKNALGQSKNRYQARKLEVKEINKKDWKIFLNKNHIQGYAPATLRLGLYDNNNLIQGIGITRRSHKSKETELNRMCTLVDCQVQGGFSKLIKEACKKWKISSLTSYVDLRLFSGEGYKKVGFVLDKVTPPTYFYTRFSKFNGEILHPRYHFTRRLIEKYYNEQKLAYWNPEETEEVNMQKNGFSKIYNCGIARIVYNYIEK